MYNNYKKIKKLGFAAVLLLMGSFVTSCSQGNEDIGNAAVRNTLHFEIYDGGTTTRAATDALTLTTTFSTGDEAGLYIVKGGNVLFENVKLTYNILGEWEATTPIEVSSELSGAQFYAYYPYQEEVSFDVAAANPLQTYVDGVVPSNDQSSQEKFEEADVMVGTTSTVGSKNTVSLALQHQKSLVYMELPNVAYTFDNENLEPYVVAQAENASFTLNGSKIQPYMEPASQSYRFIVNPGQTGTLKVSFDDSGKSRSYEISKLSQLQKGQFAKYVIDGGVNLTNYGTLQIGDYFCADGSLVSKDTPAENLPSNIVGVIFRIGTTEGLKAVNSNWSHAVAVSLKEPSGKIAWGATRGTDANSTWYSAFGLEKYRKIETAAHETEMPDNGYLATQAWMSIPASDANYKLTSVMQTTFSNWKSSNEVASSSTGWFVPSLKDWKNIEAVYDSDIRAQIIKAGGTDFNWYNSDYRQNRYWSTQLRDGRYMLPYAGKTSSIANRYAGVELNYEAYYRFLIAF